jgi:hypothetical protein
LAPWRPGYSTASGQEVLRGDGAILARRAQSADRLQSGLDDLRVEAFRLIALPLVGLGLAVLALNFQRGRSDSPPSLSTRGLLFPGWALAGRYGD